MAVLNWFTDQNHNKFKFRENKINFSLILTKTTEIFLLGVGLLLSYFENF